MRYTEQHINKNRQESTDENMIQIWRKRLIFQSGWLGKVSFKMECLRWGWNNKKKAVLLRSGREDSGQREQLRGQRSWGGSTSGYLWNTHIRMSRARHLRRCSRRWGWGGNKGPDLRWEGKESGLVLSVKGSSQGALHRGSRVCFTLWDHSGCTAEREHWSRRAR